jgi:hypothetical protein
MLKDASQKHIADIIIDSSRASEENLTNVSIENLVENGMALILLNKLNNLPYDLENNHLVPRLNDFSKQLHIIHELQRQAFKVVFEAFSKNHMAFIVLKGWALAYSVYDAPYLRPKTDIDILIEGKHKKRAKEILSELGYANPRGWEPREIIDQFSMRKTLVKGIYANIDVHLELTNDKALQPLFSWQELLNNSEYQPELSVKILNKSYALLHAVIHLLHHSCNSDDIKLIWFYDLYLILKNLSHEEKVILLKKIDSAGLSNVMRFALEAKQSLFPLSQTSEILNVLSTLGSDSKFIYLTQPPSRFDVMFRNFKQTTGLAKKTKVIQETFFPPKEEIYLKYGKNNGWPLPLLYLKRIVSGAIRLLSKTK